MTTNMTKADAYKEIRNGMYATRIGWGICRIIRLGVESDWDFLNIDPTGIIVEDCKQRVCDCAIVIYVETPEDNEAIDWVVMTKEEAI